MECSEDVSESLREGTTHHHGILVVCTESNLNT